MTCPADNSHQPSPSTSPSLDHLLETAFTACDEAGEILNRYFGKLKNIDEKFQAGLVSEADRDSEKVISEVILKSFPSHSILGEEAGLIESDPEESRKGGLWIVDPLDGTTNYVHQFPVFAISIGLELHGELVLGVVDAPKLGMRFHAVKGGGAFVNGEPMRVSTRNQFRDGLYATGFFGHDGELDQQLAIVACTIREARGIRRAGAAALDLCFVAQGVFDAFWEKNLKPWDTAAGAVIVREAGGVVTDMEGGAFNPRSPSILAGNPVLHAELLGRIKKLRTQSC